MQTIPEGLTEIEKQALPTFFEILTMSLGARTLTATGAELSIYHEKEEPIFWDIAGEIVGKKDEVAKMRTEYNKMLSSITGEKPTEVICYVRGFIFGCKTVARWDKRQESYLLELLSLKAAKEIPDVEASFVRYLVETLSWPDKITTVADMQNAAIEKKQTKFIIQGSLKNLVDNQNGVFYSEPEQGAIAGQAKQATLQDLSGKQEILLYPTALTNAELAGDLVHFIVCKIDGDKLIFEVQLYTAPNIMFLL